MNKYIELDCPLTTEHQALVDTLNTFLDIVPDNEDSCVAQRLAMTLLETADVAPQAMIGQSVGLNQARSVRLYKQRLQAEGIAGLFDRPITGRPAVTTQPAVEKGVVQTILNSVISEQSLLDDIIIATQVNKQLSGTELDGQITPSMVETIRLRLGIYRPTINEQLYQATIVPESEGEAVCLGRTGVGGAFILTVLLIEKGWLRRAELLPMASGYAVTSLQWLLTAIFAVVFGVKRAFHLDGVTDIGFSLITGRVRPLSHSTFQHLHRAIPAQAAQAFYQTTAQQAVQDLGSGTHRVSVDGHNLPRYTQIVDLEKGRIGNTGRTLKAEEMVLAFDLDAQSWLALRTYHGTNKLSKALPEIVQELREHSGALDNFWRIFFDKGGYQGLLFQKLSDLPDIYFYTPAKRYPNHVEKWEALAENEFDDEPFVYDKHLSLPAEEQPTYKLADTEMDINVRQKNKIVGTVTLRVILLHNPAGTKPAQRWPFVLLTNDKDEDARTLLNEYGDHWGQEIGHRVGRHDLNLDIVPPGYTIVTERNAQGELEREIKFDDDDKASFFLAAWLRCLVYNLMSLFGRELGQPYEKLWAGTLLRKFIRRSATLYLVGKELLVVFDPFPEHQALLPLLDKLNKKRMPISWLNNLVVQFSVADSEPMYPLRASDRRNRLFGGG
jgi:hypothetical protein